MRTKTTGLVVATLLAGLAAAPMALAQADESEAPMMEGDMQGMMEMMRMMAQMGPMMEACTEMMQAMANHPDAPAMPQTEGGDG